MKLNTIILLCGLLSIPTLIHAQTPWVQPIVQSVSGDSVFATIADLQPIDRMNASNCMLPANYLRQRLEDYSLDTVFFHYFLPNTPPNVIGIRYGTVTPGEYWVMGAHYDAVLPGAGADDNASGTAAVIEMARVIKDYELEKSLMLVLFAAEEVGLWGSHAFVDSAVNHFNIAGMINLDMIAYSHLLEDSSVSVCYRYFCLDLLDDFQYATAMFVPELIVDTDSLSAVMYSSDHAPFWQKGIPALFLIENSDRFGGAFNPYYHQYADTIGMGANSKWLAEKITRSAIATLLYITSPFTTISVDEPVAGKNTKLIFPNPARTSITITSTNGSTDTFNAMIFDLNGRLVLSEDYIRTENTVDISMLPVGVYTIKISSRDEIVTERLIKVQ